MYALSSYIPVLNSNLQLAYVCKSTGESSPTIRDAANPTGERLFTKGSPRLFSPLPWDTVPPPALRVAPAVLLCRVGPPERNRQTGKIAVWSQTLKVTLASGYSHERSRVFVSMARIRPRSYRQKIMPTAVDFCHAWRLLDKGACLAPLASECKECLRADVEA